MELESRTTEEILLELRTFDSVADYMRGLFRKEPDNPIYIRRKILVASAYKIAQQAKAIHVLHQAGCFEEGVGVSRTTVEVAINALYLQEAVESEVISFISFDSQKISERLARDAAKVGDLEVAVNYEAMREGIQNEIGKKGTEFSWSSMSLAKRAAFFDRNHELEVLSTLHDMSSRLANFAVHGTFLSLIHHFAEDTTYDDDRHRQNMFRSALLNTYQTMQSFNHFATHYAAADGVLSANS